LVVASHLNGEVVAHEHNIKRSTSIKNVVLKNSKLFHLCISHFIMEAIYNLVWVSWEPQVHKTYIFNKLITLFNKCRARYMFERKQTANNHFKQQK
jgi:hypothetical protein